MNLEQFKRLAEVINHQFRPAVTGLDDDFVVAVVNPDGEFVIKIGARMVWLDGKLDVLEAETCIADMPKNSQ